MKKIRNNGDWYIAGIVERSENVGTGRSNPNRRGLTWLNHVLINADSPEKAYDKALRIGKAGTHRYKSTAGSTVQWKFIGIAELLPIYEDIADGAEITWSDLGYISAKRAQAMARNRRELLTQASIRP